MGYEKDVEMEHSVFIIQYKDSKFKFHYDGRIAYEQYKEDVNSLEFHTLTKIILPEEVPAFITFCKENVLKNGKPIYAYFYDGGHYNKDGSYFSNEAIGERMTCVGFGLSVLKGFVEDEYLLYNDWHENTHADDNYLENYCRKHQLDIEKVRKAHRRITPLEFMISGLFNKLPITKKQIDGKKNQVVKYLSSFERI